MLSLSSLMCSHIFYTVFHAVFPTFYQQCPNSVPTVCPLFPLSFQKVSPKFPIHFPQFPLSLPSGPQKFPHSFPTVTPTVYYTVSPQYALSYPTVSLQYPNCFPTFSQPYNLPPPPRPWQRQCCVWWQYVSRTQWTHIVDSGHTSSLQWTVITWFSWEQLQCYLSGCQ